MESRTLHMQLADNIWYLPNSQAVIQFEARDSAFSDPNPKGKSGEFEFYKWGKNNLLPQEMTDLVVKNHLKPKLITEESNYLHGAGLRIFKKTIVNGKEKIEPAEHPEIQAFLDAFDSDEYIEQAIHNYVMTSNVFTQLVFDIKGRVVSLSCKDSTDVRAEIIDPTIGQIRNYGICPDWSKGLSDKNPLIILPAYQADINQATAIYHGRKRQMGQKYYSYADWWGTETWTNVSNLIPLFHKNGLGNGYNLKYLIKVPNTYFSGKSTSEEELKKEKEKLRDSMDEKLAGAEKNEMNIFTTYDVGPSGQPQAGIMIETIGRTDSDKAYIELDKQANANQALGHNISPSLAGIATGEKLGGSGSEMRIASQLHIAQKTPKPRQILLKPFEIAKKRNGWPKEFYIAFADIEITSLDQNPTGTNGVVDNGQAPV